MIRVLLSGQAAIAVTFGPEVYARPLDAVPFRLDSTGSAMRLFAGCTDVTEHSVSDVNEADALVENAWAHDRALRLFLLMIDPDEPKDEVPEHASALEELLSYDGVTDFVAATMRTNAFPSPVETDAILQLSGHAPQVTALLSSVFDLQRTVQRVFGAFDSVPAAAFDGGEAGREAFFEGIRRGNELTKIIDHVHDGKDITFLALKLVNQSLSQRQAILLWIEAVQGIAKRRGQGRFDAKDVHDDYETPAYEQEEKKSPNFAAFKFVRDRQKLIVDLIKDRQLDKAKATVRHLISIQRQNSTSEQIGKTLSLLAQEAKLHDLRELQFEWAQWATIEHPADPRTYGHLSDALMALGRFAEAEQALAAAESAGGRLFAEGGRARLLRAMGRLSEARERYLAAAVEFKGWNEVEHVLVGAADTLIEMGQSEEAIIELKAITAEYPLASSAWSSLAAALIDVGKIDEALVNVGKFAANKRTLVALTSRADVLAKAGQFDEAVRVYDELIVAYPSSVAALCGAARLYRWRGFFDKSRELYDIAAIRCPYSPRPFQGKAALELETGRVFDAIQLYDQALKVAPYAPPAMVGLLRCFLSLGRHDEVIARADELLTNHAYLIPARIAKAQALYGLNRPDAALANLDEILVDHPHHVGALSAKANILIRSGQRSAAAQLLPDIQPVTQAEWLRFVMRALMAAPEAGTLTTANKLKWALGKCPFYPARKLLRSALISLYLRADDVIAARSTFEQAPDEVSTIVEFHVFAAARNAARAKKVLGSLEKDGAADVVLQLATEIGKQNSVIEGQTTRSVEWQNDMQVDIILAQAA